MSLTLPMEDGRETCCPRLDREPWHWPGNLFSEPLSQAGPARVKRHPEATVAPSLGRPSTCTLRLRSPTTSLLCPGALPGPRSCGQYLLSGCLSSPPQDAPPKVAWAATTAQLCPLPPTFWVKIFRSLFLKILLNFLKTCNFFSAEREGAVGFFLFFGRHCKFN